jgi:hypothetical protein
MWVKPQKPGVQSPADVQRGLPRPGQTDDIERRVRRLEQPQITVLQPFVVADLPDAADNLNGLIMVTNEAGGIVPAFSDGTHWRRVTDRAVVS